MFLKGQQQTRAQHGAQVPPRNSQSEHLICRALQVASYTLVTRCPQLKTGVSNSPGEQRARCPLPAPSAGLGVQAAPSLGRQSFTTMKSRVVPRGGRQAGRGKGFPVTAWGLRCS